MSLCYCKQEHKVFKSCKQFERYGNGWNPWMVYTCIYMYTHAGYVKIISSK